MEPERPLEHLIKDDATEAIIQDGKVIGLEPEKHNSIINLSKKERALRFNGFVVTNDKGEIVFEDRKRYSQHFFPLSVLDYAKALYNFEINKQPIPILSIDSHDVLGCDFKCRDCLSAYGTNFPKEDFPKDNFKMDLNTYKKILESVANYSKDRGFSGVRFEQSGEGNPDFYKYRQQILRHAKKLQMKSVYVSSGSKIDDSLMNSLVENASFIRISFPGIGRQSYQQFSGQEAFTYKNSLDNLRKMIAMRDEKGKTRELMIGARAAIRENHDSGYYDFANTLKEIGVDSLQIVKLLVPKTNTPSDFPLSPLDKNDLEEAATLNDATFNVNIPHNLNSAVYSRKIKNRVEFPSQCFSAMFQPVLTGRSLFVCTIGEIMYNHNLRLGTFSNKNGELERFLSAENVSKVTAKIPSQCDCCSNIYDNMLLFSLQKTYRENPGKLNFYEIIK